MWEVFFYARKMGSIGEFYLASTIVSAETELAATDAGITKFHESDYEILHHVRTTKID